MQHGGRKRSRVLCNKPTVLHPQSLQKGQGKVQITLEFCVCLDGKRRQLLYPAVQFLHQPEEILSLALVSFSHLRPSQVSDPRPFLHEQDILGGRVETGGGHCLTGICQFRRRQIDDAIIPCRTVPVDTLGGYGVQQLVPDGSGKIRSLAMTGQCGVCFLPCRRGCPVPFRSHWGHLLIRTPPLHWRYLPMLPRCHLYTCRWSA